jgi:hypothetical protein
MGPGRHEGRRFAPRRRGQEVGLSRSRNGLHPPPDRTQRPGGCFAGPPRFLAPADGAAPLLDRQTDLVVSPFLVVVEGE